MSKIQDGQLIMAISPVHYAEINAIPDQLERLELLSVLEQFGELLNINKATARKRAEELFALGFGLADSAHIAFAEAGKAKFITCDDKLMKKCRKHAINTWCGNPVQFCAEEDLR
ncbi:MAG: PIN domain-containing protein [Proteobacteria bacterium]|nr:PIN domain-containing protein [Pseudomonadota bacterium]